MFSFENKVQKNHTFLSKYENLVAIIKVQVIHTIGGFCMKALDLINARKKKGLTQTELAKLQVKQLYPIGKLVTLNLV